MKEEKYQMLRIWKSTHTLLRKIAAFRGESLIETLDRMANEEWRRVQHEEGENKDDVPVQKDQAGNL